MRHRKINSWMRESIYHNIMDDKDRDVMHGSNQMLATALMDHYVRAERQTVRAITTLPSEHAHFHRVINARMRVRSFLRNPFKLS